MCDQPTVSELDFLRQLKMQHGFLSMSENIEHVLDIASYESNGDTDACTKQKMFAVKQLVISLRALALSS